MKRNLGPALRSVATKGFIDPISLITLGFLIVGLVVTTSIVKNPEKLDIRQWAYELEDEELKFINKARKTKIVSKQPAQDRKSVV